MKINFIKASASRICAWSMCVAVALLTAVSFTSCSSDDDNGGGSSAGDQDGLVSSDLPSQGWTGSEQNGIVTYKPYYDEPSYFAFNFKDGVCDNAVYNIVFESEAEARYICDMLRDGTWIFEGDEDVDGMEDPEYSYSSKSRTLSAYPTSILSRNVCSCSPDICFPSFSKFRIKCSRRFNFKVFTPVLVRHNDWVKPFSPS